MSKVKVFRILNDIRVYVLAMPRAKGRNTQHVLELLDINNIPVSVKQSYNGNNVQFTVSSESEESEHKFIAFFNEDAVGVSNASYKPFPMRLVVEE